jgi:hypothetical protein
LEVDKRIVKHVKREVGDLVQVCGGEFNANFAEVVTSIVTFIVLRDEPRGIVKKTTVGAVIGSDASPLVSSLTNVVSTEELFVDILGDAGVALLKLKDFFSGEEAIQKRLDANPVGGHLFAEKLESIAFGSGALDDFRRGVTGVGVAVGVVDLAERGARIVESTTKAECFLLGGVIEGPRLLLETAEICGVRDQLLHIQVVEILTAFTEKGVKFATAIEIELV